MSRSRIAIALMTLIGLILGTRWVLQNHFPLLFIDSPISETNPSVVIERFVEATISGRDLTPYYMQDCPDVVKKAYGATLDRLASREIRSYEFVTEAFCAEHEETRQYMFSLRKGATGVVFGSWWKIEFEDGGETQLFVGVRPDSQRRWRVVPPK